MWGAALMYLVVIFVTIMIVYFAAWLNKPVQHTPTDSFIERSRQPNPPSAFTWEQKPNGQFVNYYLNSEGELEKFEQDQPVRPDGSLYYPREKGLILEENDRGFLVQGIQTPFHCPVGTMWDKMSKFCRAEPICGPEDEGQIKGITQYQLAALSSARALSFHPRVYAICRDSQVELGYCEGNQIFNQRETQPADSNPCEYFDVCTELAPFSRHRLQIGPIPLEDNQFYLCVDGTSQIQTCDGDLVFDSTRNGCFRRTTCWEQPDGQTVEIPNNPNQFIRCENQQAVQISCPLGIFREREQLECINPVCGAPSITDWNTNEVVSQPICATGCFDQPNVPTRVCCDGTLITKEFPIPYDEQYVDPKSNLIEPIRYFDKSITLTSETTVECVSVEFETVVQNAIASASYNVHFPTFSWNVLKNRPLVEFPEMKWYYVRDQNIYTVEADGEESFVTLASYHPTSPSAFFVLMQFTPDLFDFTKLTTLDGFIHAVTAPWEYIDIRRTQKINRATKRQIKKIRKSNSIYSVPVDNYPYPRFSVLFAQRKQVDALVYYNLLVVVSVYNATVYQVSEEFFALDRLQTESVEGDDIFRIKRCALVPDFDLEQLNDVNFRFFNAYGRQLAEGPYPMPLYWAYLNFTNLNSVYENVHTASQLGDLTALTIEEIRDLFQSTEYPVPDFSTTPNPESLVADFAVALESVRLLDGSPVDPLGIYPASV